MSFYSACSQQLIANFQILMYFHAFVPLSIMSSSGILVVLPASLHCCSLILYTFLIYKGPIFMLKKGVFLGKNGVVKNIFRGVAPGPRSPISCPGSMAPEIFPARTATEHATYNLRIENVCKLPPIKTMKYGLYLIYFRGSFIVEHP